MVSKKQIGLFWHQDAFYFAEAVNNELTKTKCSPFKLAQDISHHPSMETVEGIKLTEIIQKSLQSQQILTSSINLSIPTKDIIFRTFIIPWMQPSEVKGVVEFEASKYTPFELSSLSYTFHSVNITKNKKRQILVLFVAMRRDTLENYVNILAHSGLRVESIEPGPLSLLRVLIAKKQIPKNKIIALVETTSASGRIIIIDKGIPFFIREFQLSLGDKQASANADALQARLFNETRISLDYYGRQNPDSKLNQIILLSTSDDTTLAQSLGKYLNIPNQNLNIATLLNAKEITDVNYLKAFGVCLRNTVATHVNFDLSLKATATEEEKAAPSLVSQIIKVAVAICISILVVGGSSRFSSSQLKKYQDKVSDLKLQLGMYETSSTESIQSQTDEITNKLKYYQGIRVNSEIGKFLTMIPRLLPEGVWLNQIQLSYQDEIVNGIPQSRIALELNGLAYLDNANKQIALVNKFVDQLNADKTFSSFFKSIILISANRQDLKGHKVVRYKISCQ